MKKGTTNGRVNLLLHLLCGMKTSFFCTLEVTEIASKKLKTHYYVTPETAYSSSTRHIALLVWEGLLEENTEKLLIMNSTTFAVVHKNFFLSLRKMVRRLKITVPLICV